jgi:riboflavin kinase/FMN adenylyltransferase
LPGHVHALTDIQLDTRSIVSIGVFDGVHLGHQELVQRLVTEARASGRTSVVLTFFPHPDVVLKQVTGRYYLTSPEERARLLLEQGVDLVITHKFDEQVSQIRAAVFVDQLSQHLRMSALWVGADFALGYKREGNVDFLRAAGESRGFTVDTVDLEVGISGQVISSSRVREGLLAGDVARVVTWLGRPYSLEGEVISGDRRGRTIGYPTANLLTWDEQLLPANGVYACWAYYGDMDARYKAMVNIGVQPTFDGTPHKVEAHLLDFEGELYGQTLRLEFVERLRPEKKFSGIEELVAQIEQDVTAGRAVLTEMAECEEC